MNYDKGEMNWKSISQRIFLIYSVNMGSCQNAEEWESGSLRTKTREQKFNKKFSQSFFIEFYGWSLSDQFFFGRGIHGKLKSSNMKSSIWYAVDFTEKIADPLKSTHRRK